MMGRATVTPGQGSSSGQGSMEPVLQAVSLSRSFGPVAACDRISFSLQRGEVLALVGENGAGKTTLLSLLMGFYRPDGGEIRVDGETVRIRGPADAEALGLGMVHQHFTLVPPLTAAENVVLGREPRRGPFLDRRRAEREVAGVARASGLPVDPRARVDGLSVGGRQRVEILRVLWRGARVVAFDEPTAALSPGEAGGLLATIRGLARDGRAILFVSHKLREVATVADRIAILRAGRLVATLPAAGADLDRVAALMVVKERPAPPPAAPSPRLRRGAALPPSAPGERGRPDGRGTSRGAPEAGGGRGAGAASLPVPPGGEEEAASAPSPRSAPPALTLTSVSCLDARGAPALRALSLAVGRGEIVGVAGVDGNGQRELAEVATGLRRATGGRVELAGHDVTLLGPGALRARGVAHIPEDRERGGLCGALSVAENLALGRASSPPFCRGRWLPRLDRRAMDAVASDLIRRFGVRPEDPDARAAGLSGGNQQKVVLARELSGDPVVVVAVHPTRGLDLRATAAVHDRLREQAARGAGVLIVSFDLDELRAVAHRLVVLCGGRIAGEAAPAATDAELSRLIAGAA